MKTWLKRVTTSLIATTLLFSTSMLAFAEPEADTNTETVATQTEHQSYDTLYTAVYVSDIMYSNNDIPDITLSITGKNGSDTLTLTRDNFDSDKRAYSGSFNIGSFSADDEISIAFSSSSENTYLTLIQGSNPVVVKNDPVTCKIESFTYSDPGDTEPTTVTYGGYINSPLRFNLNKEVTPSTITLTLKDESGTVLPNIQIKCATPTNDVIKSYTSDANGNVAVDYSAFGDFINVISCDKEYEINGTNSCKMITSPKEGKVYTVALKKAEKEEEAETSLSDVSFTVNVSYSGNPALFDKSKKGLLELNFSTDRDTFTVGNLAEGSNVISIPKGVYNITSSKDYLPITPLNNIDTDSKEINVVCTPTYTLKVMNSDNADLRANNFEVININSLKDSKFPYDSDYSVMPGQSIMLRDPVSLKAYNVAIKEGSYTSTVDLASGKIAYSGTTTSGKTNPKTGDAVTIIITIAIIALILIAFLVFYLIKNKKKINGNKLLSLLLALTFVSTSGIFTTKEAYALGGGGSGTGGGNSAIPPGAFWFQQVDENGHGWNNMLIKMSLVINCDETERHWDWGDTDYTWIKEDSSISELAVSEKFENFDYSALYIAPPTEENKGSAFNRAYHGGLIGTHYNTDSEAFEATYKLGYTWRDNESDDSAKIEEWQRHRLIDVEGLKNGASEYDLNSDNEISVFFKFISDACDSVGNFYDSKGHQTDWGAAFNAYCIENLKSYNENSTFNEAAVVTGYIEYLAERGLIDANQKAGLQQAYAGNKLTLLVENVLGAPINDPSWTGYYFITAHDMTSLIYSAFNGQRGKRPIYSAWPTKEAAVFGPEYLQKRIFGAGDASKGRDGYKKSDDECVSYNALCANERHIAFSGIQSLLGKGLNTLYPIAQNSGNREVSSGSNINNPFGGWGFYELKHGSEQKLELYPGLWATIEYRLFEKDENGDLKYIGIETETINDWNKDDLDVNDLRKLDEREITFSIKDSLVHGDKAYTVIDKTAPLTGDLFITENDDDNNSLKSILAAGQFSTDDALLQVEEELQSKDIDFGIFGDAYEDIGFTAIYDSNGALADVVLSENVESLVLDINELLKGYTEDELLTKLEDYCNLTGVDAEKIPKIKNIMSYLVGNLTTAYDSVDIHVPSVYKNKVLTEQDNGTYSYYLGDLKDCNADIFNKLSAYLGNLDGSSKYAGTSNVGNVKIVFSTSLVVEPEGTVEPDPLDANTKVPQWRINRYWNNILNLYPAGTEASTSYGTLNLRQDTGHSASSSKLTNNSGSFTKHKDISNSPFVIDTIFTNKKPEKVTFNHSNPSTPVKMWSDLMAYKNGEIDNLVLANWVGDQDAKYGEYELDVSDGTDLSQGDEQITKPVTLSFNWTPNFSVTHKYYYRKHTSCSRHGSHCRCSSGHDTETPSFVKQTDAIYNLEVLFNCYNNIVDAPQTLATSKLNDDNGYAAFTKQSDKTLSVYAEVPMFFTAQSDKSNSIKYVVADKKTNIKPISYHTLKYDTKITPTITGTSVATDVKAYNWLNDNSMSGAQMINRGSGTNTSYETVGTLTATTYAIDMNSDKSVLKSAWNTSGYSAESINNDFLLSFASANTDGTYNAALTSTEKLLISDQEYGDDKTELTATSKATTSTEYKLTLRAGEIMAINGNTNWTSAYPDLVEPLERMKADHNGVFSVFASQKGDNLTEQEFADLSVAARQGSTSIQAGKGWYSEDSTVISLFVYETEFTLPSSVHSNKVPVSIAGLESPQNKEKFYDTAVEGNLILKLSTQSDDTNSVSYLEYRTDNTLWNGDTQQLYAVPNVSIQDTTR